jgi:hypothetical protein
MLAGDVAGNLDCAAARASRKRLLLKCVPAVESGGARWEQPSAVLEDVRRGVGATQ